MKHVGLHLVAVSLLLSCALPQSKAAPVQASAQSSSQGTTQTRRPGDIPPIRFGDPEPLAYAVEFFPGARYDASIPTPDAILGQRHGTRLSHHAEILTCFRAWAATSKRIRVETFARTHEGRELLWAAISSPENIAKLDAIRADMQKLHDPRGLADAEAQRILEGSPAVAWMGYSIHGDELSGSDAAVALGYHLVASQDQSVTDLLAHVVVVIDPCLNPDGRERIIGMVEQSAGRTANLDYASMQRGRWPFGRGNHYLFDMNRDWMAGTQPETRGRWQAVNSFHPQLFVDAHEMGSDDTFLFYPQAEPYNPNLPAKQLEWNKRYAADAAGAFDAHGWGYYTREWADAWGPFYSDAWAALTGAVGILYEQARTSGFPLKRDSGKILTYREAVHHQLAASWSNLNTLLRNRSQALADYLANARVNVAAETPGNERMFVMRPQGNGLREHDFLRTLLGQGIEVQRAAAAFDAANVVQAEGQHLATRNFPAGTWIVRARQPARAQVHAFLDFDPRYDTAALQREREELERKGQSKAYDITSWCLAHALDLDAAWCDIANVDARPIDPNELDARVASLASVPEPAPVGWVVDALDDRALAFAARALDLGLAVHASDEAFPSAGRTFARGSFLVRRGENEGTPQEVWDKVRAAADFANVTAWPTTTGRAPDDASADLGGQHFHLLARPRVALLSNSPVSTDAYGHLWEHLDLDVGVPFSILDAQDLGGIDLRRYNVLVLPDSFGIQGLLAPMKDELTTWVQGGGTLIACASAASALTKSGLGLSQVVLRQDALDDIESYAKAVERERAARHVTIDESTLWGDEPAHEPKAEGADEKAEEKPGEKAGEKADDKKDDKAEGEKDSDAAKKDEKAKVTADDDARARLFSPQGVTARGIVNPEAWITAGLDDVLPVPISGSDVFLAKAPVTAAVRIDSARTLRLSGLLWPEARARVADSAWLTVERKGNGEIILFAEMPAFRGYHLATARLFANAVVLGPGLGARQPSDW